jgi:hypothetical protein
MKKFLFAIVLLSFLSCRKSNEEAAIKGKLVHRTCASIVVQVLDSPYYSLGQNSWQQSSSKPVYQHVFVVANSCSFPVMDVGTEFTFKLLKEDPLMSHCYVCAMYDNPPKTAQIIKVVNENTGK